MKRTPNDGTQSDLFDPACPVFADGRHQERTPPVCLKLRNRDRDRNTPPMST